MLDELPFRVHEGSLWGSRFLTRTSMSGNPTNRELATARGAALPNRPLPSFSCITAEQRLSISSPRLFVEACLTLIVGAGRPR